MSARHVITQLDRKLEGVSRDLHAVLWLGGELGPLYNANAHLLPDEVIDLREAAVLAGRVRKSFQSRNDIPQSAEFRESSPIFQIIEPKTKNT